MHVVAVVALAVGRRLLIAADQRAQRGGDRGHVDIQIGRLVAVDADADLRLAGLVGALQVAHAGSLGQLLFDRRDVVLEPGEIGALEEELQVLVRTGALEELGGCTPMVRSRNPGAGCAPSP